MDAITEKSIGLDGDVFSDRRAEHRRKVLKGAVLTFNRGFGTFECIVRNQSDTGARLSFGDTSAVPNVFDLEIVGSEVKRQAQVRWRSITAIGVALLS